jgi:predicted DNA-binding protein (MmcQ/YjbR family)
VSAPAGVLERLREICRALPGTTEVRAWGHPNFKVAGKTFAAFEKYKGEWAIAFKAEPEHQQFLVAQDPRFYVSPYVGKYGWVSMKVDGAVRWREVKALLTEAHRLTAAAPASRPRPSSTGDRRATRSSPRRRAAAPAAPRGARR